MLNTILGEKIEMGQTFIKGTRVPVTKIKVDTCVVTQIKTNNRDGYWAVQLGFGSKRIKNISKSMQGHLKGATNDKYAPFFMREARLVEEPTYKVGDKIKASDIFSAGDVVSVTGASIGKGFAGVVKRWGFSGLPRTHGTAKKGRSPGSIGRGTTPGRVLKGKKMGGRMGGNTTTIANLVVVAVKDNDNEILISGAVPGSRGSSLVIKKIRAGNLADLEEKTPVSQVQEGEPQEADEAKPETAREENKEEQSKGE